MSSTVEYCLKHRSTAEITTYPDSPANGAFSELLLPAIIVLNKRYYPNKHGSAATVGTEALSMSVVQAFKSMKVFCGIILYQRDETIDEPFITIQVINFNPCAILAFNFNMSTPSVEKAMALAASTLMENSGLEGTPMLYHQTDTFWNIIPVICHFVSLIMPHSIGISLRFSLRNWQLTRTGMQVRRSTWHESKK